MEKQFIKTTFFKIMKITVLQFAFAIAFMVTSYAKDAHAQEVLSKTVTISVKNTNIKGVLKELQRESGVPFVFSSKNNISQASNLSLVANNESLQNILGRFLTPLNIGYKVVHNSIVLTPTLAFEERKEIPSTTAIESETVKAVIDNPVKGKVVDAETSEPLPGVTVKIKGSPKGTTTDAKGNYSISVPKGATLVFSFVGMKSQEVAVDGKTEVNISLAPDNNVLAEVAVVSDGYGVVKKTDMTGSVVSMSARDLKNIPLTSAAQAMAGRMAGVSVQTTDGSPDADVVIRVRGGGSVTQDNSPLYVVDGFIVSSIRDVAPSDIESINVLKDAAATAIYGAQAANGVIVITTKKPKAGKTSVSYNGFVQFKTLPTDRKYKVLSPYEYVLANYELAKLNSVSALRSFEKFYGKYDDLDLYKNKKGTDWQDELFGAPRISQQHNISVGGGSETTMYNVSVTNNTDQGLLTGNAYTRNIINFKLNHKLSNNLKFDANARITSTEVNGAGTAGAQLNIKEAVQTRPTNGIADELDIDLTNPDSDDDYASFLTALTSPTKLLEQDWRKKNTNDYILSAGLTWTIIKNLDFKTTLTGSKTYDKTLRFYGPLTGESFNNGGSLPIGVINTTETNSVRLLNTIGYILPSKTRHKLDILLGQETYSITGASSMLRAEDFRASITPEALFANVALGRADQISSADATPMNRLSGFGRLNYQFKDRYLATFTFRADASSKFQGDNKVGYFPAVALGWKLSEEKIFKRIKAIDELKLRVSYGATGNDRIDATATSNLLSPTTLRGPGFGNTFNTYYTPASSTLANPNLKWETTINKNIGLDFGLFKQRLTGSIDLYDNTTKDLLLKSAISTSSGFTEQWNNIGSTSNRGAELSLSAYLIDNDDFTLSANFNVGKNITKIIALDGTNSRFAQSNWASTDLKERDDYYLQVDGSVGDIYGYVSNGFYTSDDFASYNASTGKYTLKDGVPNNAGITGGTLRPGMLKLVDLNDDKVIDSKDRKVIGNTLPEAQGGFGLNAKYKGFDASIFFNWSYGNDVYNAGKLQYTMFRRVTYGNLLDMMNSADRYTYIDTDGKYTGTAGGVVTDLAQLAQLNAGKTLWSPAGFSTTGPVVLHQWAVEDGSYIRLNNLNIGYSLPKSIISKLGMSQCRFYVTGNNLYLWTKYTGYDPEVNTNKSNALTPGLDYSSFPKSRSYTVGVNISF